MVQLLFRTSFLFVIAKKAAAGEGTWIDLFYSPLFWSLCFCHLIVMALRIAALDWGQMYLIQDLGMSQVKGQSN